MYIYKYIYIDTYIYIYSGQLSIWNRKTLAQNEYHIYIYIYIYIWYLNEKTLKYLLHLKRSFRMEKLFMSF